MRGPWEEGGILVVLACMLEGSWVPRIMIVRAGLCEDENNYGLEVYRLGRIIELGWSLPLEVRRGSK